MHQLNIMIHIHMHQVIISFDAMHELLSDAWHGMA